MNPSRPNAPDVLPKNQAIPAPATSLIHLPQRDSYVVRAGTASYSARGAKKGERVTVYYTEEAGKKVAHVFKHL
jgi:hypothetical protein